MQYAIVDAKTGKILCFFSEESKELAYETSENSNTQVKEIEGKYYK